MHNSHSLHQTTLTRHSILQNYGYSTGNTGKWVGIMVGIICGYRALGWLVLYLRRQ